MPAYIFDLYIAPYEILRFYEGRTRTVRVRDYQGQVLEFDVERILHLATREGISGTFMLTTDNSQRFLRLERVELPSADE